MTQKGLGASRGRTSEQKKFKVVLLGDYRCGRTALIITYTTGEYPEWYPEVKHFCVGVPIILVGCKTDLRSDKDLEEKLRSQGENPIKYTEGEEAGRKINAAAYLECSAKCNENVENVFREATKQALMATRVKDRVRNRESGCALL
uniref:Small monomeric GTPase n=1 Tax=Acanthochromis polyacanthus TaxID=80966 RepID=A0A3Q1GFZ1_9TELE